MISIHKYLADIKIKYNRTFGIKMKIANVKMKYNTIREDFQEVFKIIIGCQR